MASLLFLSLLVSLVAFSSASTPAFPLTSTSGFSFTQPKSSRSRFSQNSNTFCQSTSDCLNSPLGANSSCVRDYCACDFGYKKDYYTGICTRILCNYNSECSNYFANSHCFSGNCTCNVNYSENKRTQSCAQTSCTWSSDCSGAYTTCSENTCFCLPGYNVNSDGDCAYKYSYSEGTPLGTILGPVGGVALLIIIVVIVIIIVRQRRMKRAGRVISPPTRQQPAPGNGAQSQPNPQAYPQAQPHPQPQQYPGQAGYPAPSGYQQAYQPAPPMYPEPYGSYNQGPPPPEYAPPYSHASVMQTHPQPYAQSSSYQAVSSKIQL